MSQQLVPLVEGNEKVDDDFVIYGGDVSYPPLTDNIGQSFLNAMQENADRIAQIDPINDITYTYEEIRKYSIRCALEMRARTVKKGDFVMICGKNHSNLVIPFLAAIYLGATVNPIHPLFPYYEFQRMLTKTRPRIIFCDAEITSSIKKLKFEFGLATQVVTFETDLDPFMRPHDEEEEMNFRAEKIDPETAILFLMCTSGTTGFVKSVIFTHAEYYTTLVGYENDLVQREDILLLYSPLSWTTAVWIIGQIIRTGARRIICEYDKTQNLDILHRYKVTWTLLTPLTVYEMIHHPLFSRYPSIPKHLKTLIFSGSTTTNKQFVELQQIFPNTFIYNCYGTSEMHGPHAIFRRTSTKHVQMNKGKLNSVGLPVPGTYTKIVNLETGKALPRNQYGELLIKGPALTKGYYNDPETTARTIDKNGWYHTGDIAKYDFDNCLYISGRSQEVLRYKGQQVFPSELEEVIREHPAVRNACVMGRPNQTDGELPMAFVIKNEEFVDISENEIANFVKNRVSEIQQLRGGIIFIEKIPLTPAGKVRRVELQKLIRM